MTYPPQPDQPAWQPTGLPPRPPKKRRRWPWISLGAVVLLIVVISVSTGGKGGSGTSTSTPLTPGAGSPASQVAATTAPAQDTIVYTVTGGHASDITYAQPGESFQQSQLTDRTALPWSKTWTVAPDGYSSITLSIVAQNAGGGTIGCQISINGKTVASNSSTGEYAVVDCAGGGS